MSTAMKAGTLPRPTSHYRATVVAELKQLEITIPCVTYREGYGSVAFYEVRYTYRAAHRVFTDVTFRRFSEFYALHQKLARLVPEASLPSLPPKKIFGNLDPDFVNQRKTELEKYLKGLMLHRDSRISQSDDLLAFLPDAYGRYVYRSLGYIRFQATEASTFGKNRRVIVNISPVSQSIRVFESGAAPSALEEIPFADVIGVKEVFNHKCTLVFWINRAKAQDSKERASEFIKPSNTTSDSYDDDIELLVNPLFMNDHPMLVNAPTNTAAHGPPTSAKTESVSVLPLQQRSKALLFDSTEDRVRFVIILQSFISPSRSKVLAREKFVGKAPTPSSPGIPETETGSDRADNEDPESATVSPSANSPSWSTKVAKHAAGHVRQRSHTWSDSSPQTRPRGTAIVGTNVSTSPVGAGSPVSGPAAKAPGAPGHMHTNSIMEETEQEVRNAEEEVLVPEDFLPTRAHSAVASKAMAESDYSLPAVYENVSMIVTSWNLARLPPVNDLATWLPFAGGGHALIAIGLQECPESQDAMITRIHRHLGDRYYLVAHKALWEIRIYIFAHSELLPLNTCITNVESTSVATGIMGIMGNKGGVAVSLKLFNQHLCFVNCHLAPHQERVPERNKMFHEILNALKLGVPYLEPTVQFDPIFWFGDTNYRINLSFAQVVKHIKRGEFETMLDYDQLGRAIRLEHAFGGFVEGKITFPPTYRYLLKKKKDSASGAGAADHRPSTAQFVEAGVLSPSSSVPDATTASVGSPDHLSLPTGSSAKFAQKMHRRSRSCAVISPGNASDTSNPNERPSASPSQSPTSPRMNAVQMLAAKFQMMTPKDAVVSPKSTGTRAVKALPRTPPLRAAHTPSSGPDGSMGDFGLPDRSEYSEFFDSEGEEEAGLTHQSETELPAGATTSKDRTRPAVLVKTLDVVESKSTSASQTESELDHNKGPQRILVRRRSVTPPADLNRVALGIEPFEKAPKSPTRDAEKKTDNTSSRRPIRPYSAKRIPAWCDRVLWKTAVSSRVQQLFYDSCDYTVCSDHCPVISMFATNIRQYPPAMAYDHPCEVYFESMNISLTNPTEPVVETGPEAQTGAAALARGSSMDSSLSSNPRATDDAVLNISTAKVPAHRFYLSFYGPFLSEGSRGKRTSTCEIPIRDIPGVLSIAASWDSTAIPVLQTVVGLREYAENEKIFFVLKDGNEVRGEDKDLGQGYILLEKVLDQDSWSFETKIIKSSRTVGTLTGRLYIQFDEGDN